MNLNELKVLISEVLEEAKKKKEKGDRLRAASGGAKAAYGHYDESFDFSAPLAGYNLYRQQGAVNWGPYTSAGQHIDQNFANPNTRLELREEDETVLRHIVREVIEFGLVPPESAWAPIVESQRSPIFESPWEAAIQEARWYMQHRESNDVPEAGPKRGGPIQSTRYGVIDDRAGPAGKKGTRKARSQTKNGRSA
jgi:hypothetical protein